MPVVLVHGVPDTHRIWDTVRPHLERKDIITVDLPGFGNPLPSDFKSTKEEYLDWLINRIAEIGQPVDLVGHDWGSLLTGRLASIRPELVRTWTGISGPIDPEFPWHYLAKIWQTPGEGEQWMKDLDLSEFALKLVEAQMPKDVADEAVRHMDDTMRASILALYRSAIEVGAEWKPGLSNMTAPALVIWGLDDPFLPHRFADELGNASLARAVVKLRASHWPMNERPADVARELEAHWTHI